MIDTIPYFESKEALASLLMEPAGDEAERTARFDGPSLLNEFRDLEPRLAALVDCEGKVRIGEEVFSAFEDRALARAALPMLDPYHNGRLSDVNSKTGLILLILVQHPQGLQRLDRSERPLVRPGSRVRGTSIEVGIVSTRSGR
jgi:hypothetical protein